ncbi:IucA/IucC family protein [Yinghuangia aomiensis]
MSLSGQAPTTNVAAAPASRPVRRFAHAAPATGRTRSRAARRRGARRGPGSRRSAAALPTARRGHAGAGRPEVRLALGGERPDGAPVVLTAALAYRSPTGWHRFGAVRRGTDLGGTAEVGATELAALLAAEHAPQSAAEFAARVADSVARTTSHLVVRRAEFALGGAASAHVSAAGSEFLDAEQALVLGHPFHPTPHSRQYVDEPEAKRFSPELRGRFPLHWFAADPDVVRLDADLLGPLPEIFAALAGPGLDRPPGTVVFPAHPWQAREAVVRPGVRALLDAGHLHDLGPAGPDWSPTSSVRTLYRADAPVMLKTSLGAEIADSRRENLHAEMRRGLAVHRILDAGLKRVLHGAHPGFDVLRDLGWLTLRGPGAEGESGLELVVRDNPFGPRDRVLCVAGLTAARPDALPRRSLLGRTIHALALHTGRPLTEVAETWLRRYLDVVVAPVLWLYADYGLGLEAHQQNMLVVLDGGRLADRRPLPRQPGPPLLRDARGTTLARWLPADVRDDPATWATDAVVDERLGYCVGVNNVLGLVGAMGSQGLADEEHLLGHVRAFLARVRAGQADRDAGDLIATLLDAPTIRCKANLHTRVAGLAHPCASGREPHGVRGRPQPDRGGLTCRKPVRGTRGREDSGLRSACADRLAPNVQEGTCRCPTTPNSTDPHGRRPPPDS